MVTYAMFSRQGERNNNEDSIRMKEKRGASVFLLADGLGGHGAGEVASQMTVNYGIKLFERLDSYDTYLKELFEDGQRRLLNLQRIHNASEQMKTTLVALLIQKETAAWGHIGDSRLYLFEDGILKQRTLDHSVPQMLVKSGEISEADIRTHPDRNRLLRVMGNEWERETYDLSRPIRLTEGMSFLMCSDGFWEYITEEWMEHTLRNAKSVAHWLNVMEKIVQENGHGKQMDNFSAIGVWIR
ncbi:MAG: protein phosphatase 2C domain-containing protein [Lachnospiraceae bacterium]|nr:protein phosphatase 2C domain-containing protein [Robinsoniella sp.]MDY3766206.1 protein phosphatase 2C domain-containing protein [Lachnospiraceae bacterium]